MTRKLVPAAVFLLLSVSSLSASRSPGMTQRSPKDEAVLSYNDGLRYRDRAWNAEKQLATEQDAHQRAKLEEAVRKSYDADVRAQQRAIDFDPNLVQAHTELGYALRKTGHYDSALASYDKALTLMPNYAEAIEYRGEAYLGLNRVADARDAYLLLFNGGDQERAQLLAGAMKKWVEQRRSDPSGLSTDAVDEMAKWLAQRNELSVTGGKTASGTWK